jgi:hypothetical protein
MKLYTVSLFPLDIKVPSLSPLPAMRRGGLGVESLSSLFAKLALEHCCAPYSLVHRVLVPISERLSPRWVRVRAGEGQLVNGYGSVASSMSDALFRSTGMDGKLLTALALAEFCDPKGKHFMHMERPWCPSCYQEARFSGTPVWDPLYTYVRSTRVCVAHGKPLRFQCERCRKSQRHIPRIPFLDLCEHCGADLAIQAHPLLDASRLEQDIWVAKAFLGVMDAAGAGEHLSAENFVQNLIAIRDTHFGGHTRTMSRVLGLAKSSAKNWIERGSRPTWLSLVDLAWRLNVPPVQLVSATQVITTPEEWRFGEAQILDREHRRRSVLELRSLGQRLRRIARGVDDSIPADIGLAGVARRLGERAEFLKRKFPRSAQAVVEARDARMREHSQHQTAERDQRISTAEQRLHERGLAGTTRNLRELGGLCVTDLIRHARRTRDTR